MSEKSTRQGLIDEINKNNEKNLSELMERLSSNDSVVPYIGAGMSSPVFGTWSIYLKSIVPKYDKEGHEVLSGKLDEGDYEGAAQWVRDTYGIEFYNQTAEYFCNAKIKYESVSQAAKLLPQLFRGAVLTTNLDRIIETVYRREGISLKILLAGHSRLVQSLTRDGAPCLWKIHGDIEDRESWVLTKDDYAKQYGTSDGRLFRDYLEQVIQGKVLLFLGCSLESDMIVHILEDMGRRNPYIRHYAILPVKNGYRFKMSDREDFSRRCRQLGRLGVKPIWYPDGKYEFVERYLLRLLQARKYFSEQQKLHFDGHPYPYALEEGRYIKKKNRRNN